MGLMIKGNNQIIANNTVINTINNRNDIIILAEDCSNNNTWLYNNLAKRIGSHRSSTQFELTNDAPIPIGTVGYIMYDSDENGSKDSWRECQESDGSIYSGTGVGESMNNIDEITESRIGITLQSNVTSLIQYNSSGSKTIANYVPNSTVLFDNGISPTNLVNISPTESKTLDELVPQTSVGNNPDIGAIDQSNLWIPGIDWNPVEEFQIENVYTTLSQEIFPNEKVFIFPNPTYGIIQIENAQISKWKIFDFNGQLLQTGNTDVIDLSLCMVCVFYN